MPGFFLPHDGATRALAGAGVGAGALTADGQTTTVAQTLVSADLDLAADVGLHLATEVTLGLDVVVDVLADRDELLLGEVPNTGVRVHAGGGERLLREGPADAEHVGEGDLDALFARDVNTGNACHSMAPVDCRRSSTEPVPGRRMRYVSGPRPPNRGCRTPGRPGPAYEHVQLASREVLRIAEGTVRLQPWRCLWRGLSQMTMTRP